MNDKIVYFSINNWMYGQDFPAGEPFNEWMLSYQLCDDKWCKENKICVKVGHIDMSTNYCVTATREWVENNCPQLLTDDSYEYIINIYYKGECIKEIKTKKFSDFVYKPDNDGDNIYDKFDWSFLEYNEDNFGVTWYKDPLDEDENEDIDNE